MEVVTMAATMAKGAKGAKGGKGVVTAVAEATEVVTGVVLASVSAAAVAAAAVVVTAAMAVTEVEATGATNNPCTRPVGAAEGDAAEVTVVVAVLPQRPLLQRLLRRLILALTGNFVSFFYEY